jgi:hypothetical protein
MHFAALRPWRRWPGRCPKPSCSIRPERVRETQKLGAGAYVKRPYIMEKIGAAIRGELLR